MKYFKIILFFFPVISYGQPNPKIEKSVSKAINVISSLDSTNYSDLNFLTETLRDKRIVMLGEFTHGAKEINILKIRLIKFLHEKLGYNVLVVESDLAAMAAMNSLKLTGIAYSDLIYQGFPVIWYTPEYKEFMKFLKDEKKLQLAGVDPQLTTTNTKYYLRRIFNKVDTSAASQVFNAEQSSESFFIRLKDSAFSYSPEFSKILDSCLKKYEKFRELISKHKEDLIKIGVNETTIDFFFKLVENRYARLVYMSKYKDNGPVRFRIRDSIMAKNLEWIADSIYPNEKIIVSAHNYHISRSGNELPVMGSLLPNAIKKQTYVIGFYGINGVYGDNNGNPVELTAPSQNSLRNYMKGMKNPCSFISFNKITSNNSWVNRRIEVDGFVNISGDQNMVLSKNFDGIMIIRNITVPKYLYK